jgi:glyoxylase-like metal-dependent hydrolase (beta-lactamase superfamily II)
MRRTSLASVIALALAASSPSGAQKTDPSLDAISRAMGAASVTSIDFTGSGYTFGFAQAPGPGEPWPMFIAKTYHVSIDYTIPAMQQEIVREQGEHPPRGGLGQPMAGEARSAQMVPARQIWMTPHGLVKAAIAQGARVSGQTLAFAIEGQDVTVTVDSRNLVERLSYVVDNPVLGDVPIEMRYSDYADFSGVKFPMHIVEKTDGYPTIDITVKTVKPNAAVSFPPPRPAAAAAAAGAPPTIEAVKLAEGVWHIIASNYGSILVEFRDHLVMFEGPIDDARSMAVNEWARKTVPGKPIKYLVNTHTHFDHAGGVREYAAEGITIVTHVMNRAFLEKAWARPRTLHADKLALSGRTPIWETMTEKRVLTDGVRTLELHQIKDNGHYPYILMGYLPNEKILLYGDMYNPPSGADPRDLARTNEYANNLYQNIQTLKLDVRTLAPIHGKPVPFDNLKKAIGLVPLAQ